MLRIVTISFCELEECLGGKGVLWDCSERRKGKKGKIHYFGCMVWCVEQFYMLTDWQKLGIGKYT